MAADLTCQGAACVVRSCSLDGLTLWQQLNIHYRDALSLVSMLHAGIMAKEKVHDADSMKGYSGACQYCICST